MQEGSVIFLRLQQQNVISLTSHPFKFNLLSFDFLCVYEKGNSKPANLADKMMGYKRTLEKKKLSE